MDRIYVSEVMDASMGTVCHLIRDLGEMDVVGADRQATLEYIKTTYCIPWAEDSKRSIESGAKTSSASSR